MRVPVAIVASFAVLGAAPALAQPPPTPTPEEHAETFRGPDHLRKIQEEAQAMVSTVLGAAVA